MWTNLADDQTTPSRSRPSGGQSRASRGSTCTTWPRDFTNLAAVLQNVRSEILLETILIQRQCVHMKHAHNFINLSGKEFGRWTVLEPSSRQRSNFYWKCRCQCGNEKEVRNTSLTTGVSTSCGCAQKEALTEVNTTHGLSRTPEYQVWHALKSRCLNANNPSAKHYKERGIKVCQRWMNSFEAFLRDMGPRPSREHSIHRKDNDGDYTPKNCMWATGIIQHNATRANLFLTIGGIKKTVAEWCRERSLNRSTVYSRLRRGMSPDRALSL